jgi:hypothetical protein
VGGKMPANTALRTDPEQDVTPLAYARVAPACLAAELACWAAHRSHRDMKVVTVSMLLVITVVSVTSLVSGAGYLEIVLPGGLPAGNAIASLGLVAPAAVAVLLGAPGSPLRAAALGTFCAAVAWLPVSIALAGNLALNFTGWRGSVWLGVSLVIHVAVLCTLAWSLVARALAMGRRASAA